MHEYKINKYLKLKLEDGQTHIYVDDELFIQCKYLLINIPVNQRRNFDDFNSIDEIKDHLDNSLEHEKANSFQISPEVEFWAHCSNLQAWAENDYNTNLIHSNLAFPLLKQLYNAGDPKARTVFKEEILKRLESNYPPIFEYLIARGFFAYLSREEIEMVTSDLELMKNMRISIHDWKDEFYRKTIHQMGKTFIKKAKETLKQGKRFNASNRIKKIEKKVIRELEDRYGEHIVSAMVHLRSEVHAKLLFDIYQRIISESRRKVAGEAIIAIARELRHQFFLVGLLFVIHQNRIITIRGRSFYSHPRVVALNNQEIENFDDLEGSELLIHENVIDLSHNKLRAITGLERFFKLKELNLAFNQIEEIDFLKVNWSLKVLNLAHNNVRNLDGLEWFDQLEKLYLTGNPITTIPEGILDLPHLKELHVIDCPLEQIPEAHSIDLQVFSNRSIEVYQKETGKRAKISNRFTDVFKKWHRIYCLRTFLKCSNEILRRFKQEGTGNLFYDGKPTKGFKRWLKENGIP